MGLLDKLSDIPQDMSKEKEDPALPAYCAALQEWLSTVRLIGNETNQKRQHDSATEFLIKTGLQYPDDLLNIGLIQNDPACGYFINAAFILSDKREMSIPFTTPEICGMGNFLPYGKTMKSFAQWDRTNYEPIRFFTFGHQCQGGQILNYGILPHVGFSGSENSLLINHNRIQDLNYFNGLCINYGTIQNAYRVSSVLFNYGQLDQISGSMHGMILNFGIFEKFGSFNEISRGVLMDFFPSKNYKHSRESPFYITRQVSYNPVQRKRGWKMLTEKQKTRLNKFTKFQGFDVDEILSHWNQLLATSSLPSLCEELKTSK